VMILKKFLLVFRRRRNLDIYQLLKTSRSEIGRRFLSPPDACP
jgi:hypothetical protein